MDDHLDRLDCAVVFSWSSLKVLLPVFVYWILVRINNMLQERRMVENR